MGHFLLLVSLCVALVVALGSFLLPGTKRSSVGGGALAPPRLNPAEAFAMGLPLLGFLVTLPTHKPFAGGQGLGLGFLIGGAGAAILFQALRTRGVAGANPAGLALATLTVAAPLLVLRPVLLDALMGVAIGWFATVFLLVRAQPEANRKSPEALALIATAGSAVILAATALLGTLRDPRTPSIPKGTWSAIAVAFPAGLALLTYLVALVRGSDAKAGKSKFNAILIIALGVAILIDVFLGLKVAGGKPLLVTLLIGLLIAPLVKWLQLSARSGANGDSAVVTRLSGGSHYLVILLIVSGFMVGTQLMLGYGAALVLVALWSATILFADQLSIDDIKNLLFAAVLVLYRVYLAEPSTDLHGANISDQYALFGFVVGAAAPPLIAAILSAVRLGKAGGGRSIAETLVAGLLTLATPAFVIIVFGPKCVLALILGSAIGSVFGERKSIAPGLIALGMALAVDQFDGFLEPYIDISRLMKLNVLVVVFACLLVVVAVAALKRRGDDDNTVDGVSLDEAHL